MLFRYSCSPRNNFSGYVKFPKSIFFEQPNSWLNTAILIPQILMTVILEVIPLMSMSWAHYLLFSINVITVVVKMCSLRVITRVMMKKSVFARMKVNHQRMPFQVHCGATTNIIPQRLLKDEKINSSNKILCMWNNSEVKPLVKCRVKIKNSHLRMTDPSAA